MTRRWGLANRQIDLDAFTFYLDPRNYRPTPAEWTPRLIPSDDWETISAGVAQRLKAINRFLVDLYNDQQDIVPADVVFTSEYFYPELLGFRPPKDIFVRIYGIAPVHLGSGRYMILEDNLRIPSGISYQMKTVELGKQIFPEFSDGYETLPYEIRKTYLDMFKSVSDVDDPVCVLLTDGRCGSAFFEHRYLSEHLGTPW